MQGMCIALVLALFPLAGDAALAKRVQTLEATVQKLEKQINDLQAQNAELWRLLPPPKSASGGAAPHDPTDVQRRTAEALISMSNSERIQAAGLREFLKTATVDHYSRLGPEALRLIRSVPELSELVRKRGLDAGLANKYGFGEQRR